MFGVRVPIPGVVYPSQEDLRHHRASGALPDETLIGALEGTFRKHPDRVALSEAGSEITHRDLERAGDQWAAAMIRVGLKPLDRVIFQINNSRELMYALIGCLKAGLIPLCTLASHRRHEIEYLGNHASAAAHIVHGDDPRFDMVAFALEMRRRIPSLKHTLIVRSTASSPELEHLDRLAAEEDPETASIAVRAVPRDPFQVALFQLSGGTSDVPKIIPRFHNEYVAFLRSYIDWRGFTSETVAFTPAPFMHNAPMLTYWGPVMLAGGEVAIATSLDPQAIVRVLKERRPTWFGMPAVMIHRLKDAGVLDSSLFAGAVGFSLPNFATRISGLTGAPVYQQYGMTEGFIAACRKDDPPEVLAGTVGQPICPFDTFKIVQPGTETPVAPGEIGELVVKGPSIIRGYFDAPERNREVITADGFFRTGDLLSLRTIGGRSYLSFEGRIKDVVDRGGEKINSQEVERIAVGHPKIAAIAIVPMPDPHYGERSCAFVIPADRDDGITVRELGEFLEAKGLAKFKWPERIEIVDEFPMTNSAKLSKPQLREWIVERLKQEAARAAPRRQAD